MKWRVVPSWPDYEVSEYGDVRRTVHGGRHWEKGRWRKLQVNSWGYVWLQLWRDGTPQTRLINRVVAEAFLGTPPSDSHEAAHKDGNSVNNHYTNLKWETPRGNAVDKKIHGAQPMGVTHPLARFTEVDIKRVREMALFGALHRDIAAVFDVARRTISAIVAGNRWAHVS